MTGPVALHGGGEFRPGDERFLAALLHAGRAAVEDRARACLPGERSATDPGLTRVVLLPTAAAAERPEVAVAIGTAAFERVASHEAIGIRVDAALVLDADAARSARWASMIAGADVVYLPGGDPGHVPSVLAGSLAWQSIIAARARGAVIAGASAGAMALCEVTLTRDGPRPGLGLVPGVAVVPHADGLDAAGLARRFGPAPPGVGLLGLAERSGVIAGAAPVHGPGRTWRVVGPGPVVWSPASGPTVRAVEGGVVTLPG